jgi:hypothetical protein
VAGSCENCNETSGSIKVEELFDYLSDYQSIKNTSTPWS